MLPNMNPAQMEKLMRQMGIQSHEIPAKRVVIELEEGNLIIEQPQVTEIRMQGQTSFQIAGQVTKEDRMKEEDIALVMEKTGCTREQAMEALAQNNGDIAEAILRLEQPQ